MNYNAVPKEGTAVDQKKIYRDEFGVEWMGAIDGIRGMVQKHPLE